MAAELHRRPHGIDSPANGSVIKVVVTGSESTGKTEIVRVLGKQFDAPVSHEFVREFAKRKQEETGNPLAFSDHGPIARGQIAAEEAAIAKARDLVILDTDLVSTVIYCEHYFGRAPEWIAEEARKRSGDLYLLMRPDIPWIPDGVRDRPRHREEMHELFRNRLETLGLWFVEIGGDWNERVERATDAVSARLKGATGTRSKGAT